MRFQVRQKQASWCDVMGLVSLFYYIRRCTSQAQIVREKENSSYLSLSTDHEDEDDDDVTEVCVQTNNINHFSSPRADAELQ